MTIFHSKKKNRWTTVSPGVEFSVLRSHGQGGSTMLVRMAAGAYAPLHEHAGGEETYLISGKLRVGDHCLMPGDYLWTPPGVKHDGHAEEETVFFVVLPEGLQVAALAG